MSSSPDSDSDDDMHSARLSLNLTNEMRRERIQLINLVNHLEARVEAYTLLVRGAFLAAVTFCLFIWMMAKGDALP